MNNSWAELGAAIAKLVGAVLLVIALFVLAIYVGVGLGYLFGLLLGIAPFIAEWLTVGLPITKEQLPGIMAWLAIIGMTIRPVIKRD